MGANGGGAINLTQSPGHDSSPSFSPDGARIAFERAGFIAVMASNGSAPTNLTRDDEGFSLDPAFSPDGGKILFANLDSFFTIYVMNADGSNPTVVTPPERGDVEPDWGPHPRANEKCGGQEATVLGTAGPDKLRGGPGADVLVALGGADTVKGKGGKDIICGGPGKDRLLGGAAPTA